MGWSLKLNKYWVMTGAGLFILAIVIGAALGWLLSFLQLDVKIRQQPAQVQIIKPFASTVQINQPIPVQVQGNVNAKIPIDQTIAVPIDDTIHSVIRMNHSVPIRVNVNVDQRIPVNQTIHIDSKVTVKVLGKDITLPIRGDVPINASIPVRFTIPVNQSIKLNFSAPVSSQIKQVLYVPLKTTLQAVVPVQAHLQVPIQSPLNAQVRLPQPIDIMINSADLHIPLKTLSVHPRRAEALHQPHAE